MDNNRQIKIYSDKEINAPHNLFKYVCMEVFMFNGNIVDILSGTNVSEIKKVLSENEEESYNFLIRHFCFLPSKYCLEEINYDKNPFDAIMSISSDVDGSKGMKTSFTPEAVITLYQLLWRGVLDTKEPVKLKGRKPSTEVENFYYEMNWKDGINGTVSGDILNSFPKKRTRECWSLILDDVNFQLKLFARLCYTIGNFMPTPCMGRGKNSMNAIHSYFKFGTGYYERIDRFLYDIVNKKNSKYEGNYKDFGEYINIEYIETNYLNDYVENKLIFDLATEQEKIKELKEFTMLSEKNIKIYIENVNARIISRGNRMLKKLKNNHPNKLEMFTNENQY